jgi:mono/diheme cytochrome c family protein
MPATSADLTGASLYQLSCAACHGQDRAGNKFEVDGQTIEVPALAWDDLNSMYATDPSRGSVPEQVALAITKGQDEEGEDLPAMMPRWSSLTQGQVDSLIQYIQSADTTTGTPSLAPAATNLMGEQLYLTSCAACHGVDGAGKTFEVDGNTISTPSLSWSDMSDTYSTDPSRGSVADQLVLAITKGQDEEGEDLPAMMPRWSFLSQPQVDSLVEYLQTAFK